MADLDLETRLRAGLAARAGATDADDPARLAAIDGAVDDHRRHLVQRRRVLAGAAATVTVAAGGGLWWTSTQRSTPAPEDQVRTTDGGPGPGPTGTGPSSVPPGWRSISPAPLSERSGAAVVAIADGLVVWGGDRRAVDREAQDHLTDGARWDAETGGWTAMAPIPFESGLHASPAIAVWTGTEVLLGPIEPARLETRASADYSLSLAAYDPVADAWRALELPSPLSQPGQGPVAFGYQHPVACATTDGRLLAVTRDPSWDQEDYERQGPGCPTVLLDPASDSSQALGRFPIDPLQLVLAPAGDRVAAVAVEIGPTDGPGTVTLHWLDLTAADPVWEGGLDLGQHDDGGRADGPWWDGRRLLVQRAPGRLVAVDPAADDPVAVDLTGPIEDPYLAEGPWVWTGEVALSGRAQLDPGAPGGPTWSRLPTRSADDVDHWLPFDFTTDQMGWTGRELVQYGVVPCPDTARCVASSILVGRAYRP